MQKWWHQCQFVCYILVKHHLKFCFKYRLLFFGLFYFPCYKELANVVILKVWPMDIWRPLRTFLEVYEIKIIFIIILKIIYIFCCVDICMDNAYTMVRKTAKYVAWTKAMWKKTIKTILVDIVFFVAKHIQKKRASFPYKCLGRALKLWILIKSWSLVTCLVNIMCK